MEPVPLPRKLSRVVNPLTVITPRERGEMGANWNVLKRDVKGNGVYLFYRFFKKHPEYQKLFGAFRKVPLEELKADPRMEAHANTVMYFFSSIMDNMHDPEVLTMMLYKTGRNHARDKAPLKGFKHFKIAFLEMLHAKLGPKLTPVSAAAWDKTMDLLFDVIIVGMSTTRSGTLIVPPETPPPDEGAVPEDGATPEAGAAPEVAAASPAT